MNSRTALRALLSLTLILVATINVASTVTNSADAAKKLLDEAIDKVVAVGGENAAQDFIINRKWRQGETYIVMNDFHGKVLAHSANPKMVGKTMLKAKDASGKLFVQEGLNNIKARRGSVIELKWGSPVTKKIAPAQMISKRVPGHQLYISVLIFK
jgi:signal transduction histidine kinase